MRRAERRTRQQIWTPSPRRAGSPTRGLDAAKTLARQSQVPADNLTLVDRHRTYAHNDPNTAAPSRNEFLKKLVPFLKRLEL